MARRSAARDALEAEVRKRQRAAGQKVSRLERQGVNIKKNNLDPRRPASDISEMSARELRRYRDNLNKFTDRSNGYVAGVRGKPISKQRFTELKRLEAEFNAKSRAYESSVGGINVPGAGRTIASRLADLTADEFRGAGQRRAFEELNRQAKNLTGNDAVEGFIKDMKRMLSPGYLNARMKTQRANLEVMLEQTGDSSVLEKIKKLTNNQLNVLIDYTFFMTAVGGRYAYAKSMNVDEKPSESDKDWLSSENEDNAKRMEELIDWAGTLPRQGVNQVPNEYRNTNVGQLPQQFNPRDTRARANPTVRRGRGNRGSK